MPNPHKGLFKHFPDHRGYLTPSNYSSSSWNNDRYMLKMEWLSDDEKVRNKQLNSQRSPFWKNINNNPESKKRAYPKDMLGRSIIPGDVVLVMGKLDTTPLFVISPRTTEVILEDKSTGGRCTQKAHNLVVITDQVNANIQRNLIAKAILEKEIDLTEYR